MNRLDSISLGAVRLRAAVSAAIFALLAGCAALPTNRAADGGRMAVAARLATHGSFPSTGPDAEGRFDDGRWWERFHDTALDELIEAGLRANLDVRIALARVEQARAGTAAAAARQLPSINAVGARSRAETGYDTDVRQRLPTIDARRAALDVSWEVDLFGAARAARNAAAAEALVAEYGRRGAQLAVISEVASQYFALRGAQARAAIVGALIGSQQKTLELTELKRSAGQASEFDADRARAELSATRAALPLLQTLIAVSQYRLATLTGRTPGAWSARLDPSADLPAPLDVAAGQPAELLARRPDMMAAEAQLSAAGFRRNEAEANRYPQLVLGALFGRQWTDWNALNFGATHFANLVGTLALPLYAGGRIKAGIDAASAREREALALYERTMLQALEDVDSALASVVDDRARAGDLDLSVQARERSLDRARALYREGQADFLVVLDVERGLLTSKLDRAALQTDELLSVVQLYRALGGGWKAADALGADAGPGGAGVAAAH